MTIQNDLTKAKRNAADELRQAHRDGTAALAAYGAANARAKAALKELEKLGVPLTHAAVSKLLKNS